MIASSRRTLLGAIALGALSEAVGCGHAPPRPAARPPPPPLPPLRIAALTDLLPLARLRWLVLARPREIAAIPWLIPPIGVVVPEQNLSRFAASTGIDLRQIPEAAIAAYEEIPPEGAPAAPLAPDAPVQGSDILFYLARHTADSARIERLFRERLTGNVRRTVERPDLIRVSGKIGTRTAVMVVAGDVVGYQQGGAIGRGPARVAALYATGKLKRSPTVLSEDPLRALANRFGAAPARAFALGPFQGELARGARGLLAGATAIGAAARPSAREGIALVIAVAGDFSKSGEAASKELLGAWNELAHGSFGQLLALDQPVDPPLLTHGNDAVTVAVELNPRKLAAGLHDATGASIEEIMR